MLKKGKYEINISYHSKAFVLEKTIPGLGDNSRVVSDMLLWGEREGVIDATQHKKLMQNFAERKQGMD